VITSAELHRAAKKEGLRFDQVEKDYVVLWVLSSLSRVLGDSPRWVFKGGTCLRHCHYSGYRFSEDIDYSCRSEGENVVAGAEIVNDAGRCIAEETGMEIIVKDGLVSGGEEQLEIPVQYSRGGPRRQGLPTVKVHLTFDEPILIQPEVCKVNPPYSDLGPFNISAYGKLEIIAEKMRALLQQLEKWPRPRDLYDLWFMLCSKREDISHERIRTLFLEKCRARRIEPDSKALISDKLKEWNRSAWKIQLEPMMKVVPEYDRVWDDWMKKCREIF
jgi:predicted nucleotidyltransferase component of viral defense system